MKIDKIFIIISIIVIAGCNKSVDRKNVECNGISGQILSIVDSMPICIEEKPFITINFKICDETNDVIRFSHGVGIPIPIGDKLVSQTSDFMGYKRYKKIYLVFFDSSSKNIFEKFVQKDSLIHDEEVFQHFNVYEPLLDGKIRDCDSSQNYLVNENDSLIFYEGKCLFDID